MYDLDKFIDEAKQFHGISKSLSAGWQISQYVDGDPDSTYLSLREDKRCKDNTNFNAICEDNKDAGSDWSDTGLQKDESELDLTESSNGGVIVNGVSDWQHQLLTFEYHVLFSQSYSVPTLFFKVSLPNGKPLRLQELWDIVPKVRQEFGVYSSAFLSHGIAAFINGFILLC